MNNYPELNQALSAMQNQSDLYRPSSFWREATAKITEEIRANGVENFRNIPLSLSFFVPTYGPPGNSFLDLQVRAAKDAIQKVSPSKSSKPVLAMDQFLSGYQAALSDYRVLVASDNKNILPELHNFSESSIGKPVEHFEFEGRYFSRSSLNYLLGLSMLKKHLNQDELKVVVEIGGGFGSLGEVLSQSKLPCLKYIDLDIPPIQFIAQYYLTQALGEENVTTFSEVESLPSIPIDSLKTTSVLCNWQIEKLEGEIDLFVNFISFQEMEPNIVENYLSHINRLKTKWILMRNMREGKQVKKNDSEESVGVQEPIQTNDYIKMLPNYKVVEKNVIPFGFKTVDNYHSELILLKRSD